MKKTLNRMLMIILALAMILSLAACGETKPAETKTEQPAAEQPAAEQPAAEQPAAEEPAAEEPAPEQPAADGFDWSAYPADFNAWTTEDLKTYLLAREVLGNEAFMLIDMSAELEQMSADSGFLYVDVTEFTVNDTIIHFDASNEAGAAMLDTIRSEHAVVVGEASVPMDALVGAFAVSYSNSLDEEHIATLVGALNDLAAHYGITPDFITE